MAGAAIRADLVAALTGCAILIPEGVAYAGSAGVPPQYALYAAPVVLAVYALLGSSPRLIVGAAAAASVFSAATVSQISTDPGTVIALTAALAVLAGAILLVTGLVRAAFIADFLEPAALSGFLCGLALVIVVRQGAKFTGLEPAHGGFLPQAWRLLTNVSEWSGVSTAAGAAALVLLLVLERFLERIPGVLLVLVVSIVVSVVLHLDQHGVEVVGRLPTALPGLRPPDLPLGDWASLGGSAAGMALIVFAVSYSVAERLGDGPDPAKEMRALGVANLGAGLAGGFAVSANPSVSAAVSRAGARTRLTSLLAAVIVLLVGAFLTPLLAPLPEPVLAAVVIAAVRGFLSPKALPRRGQPAAVALTSLAGVLVFGLLEGLLLAAALSLLLFVAEATRVRVVELGRLPAGGFGDVGRHPEAERIPGLIIVRPQGALFYGNIRRTKTAIERAVHGPVKVVLLDLGASYHLEQPVVTGLDTLRTELGDVRLWLAGVHVPVTLPGVPVRSSVGAAVHEFQAEAAGEDALSRASGHDGLDAR
ncbi:SulP family inorganic anion transporter [Planotetraspora sp. GP83]|uniref:SulP family inorganic anion transporter n=1 Tax=Planotetraspora sp. GP83 TaxID=3156264 RepID=UPI003517B351